jgi:tetratricopeptide (TPR) repeat protein
VVEIADPAALIASAARLASAGSTAAAAELYQQVLARWPDQPDCWYNLALLQRRLRHYAAALESYQQALDRRISRPEQVHLNRAVIYADCLRQEAAAERELRAALALNPAYLPALQNLANLHEDLGRRAEARQTYERILTLDPRSFESLARYALLSGAGSLTDPLLARLRGVLADASLPAAGRASVNFALAHLLDGLGAYREAFAAAQAANLASRASVPGGGRYDRAAHERFIDALLAAFPRAGVPPRPAGRPAGEPRLIFVCGMFRSGSTLTERLLAGHPAVTAGGELDLLPHLIQTRLAPFPDCVASLPEAGWESLAAAYLEGAREVFPEAKYLTDKRPDNFLLIGLIKTLFPEARIVHTTRDPLDTCLSIYQLHLEPQLRWALDLADIGHYFRQYRRLMNHWRLLYGEDILDFSYDQLVRDPRTATARLLSYCGLEWSGESLDFAGAGGAVKTASVWQVRQELYQRSSGRARHYVPELAALAESLQEP